MKTVTCLCLLAITTAVHAQFPTVTNTEGIPRNGFTKLTTISFTTSGTKVGFPKISCKLDSQGPSTCQPLQTYTSLAEGSHTLVVQFALATGQVDPTSVVTFTWTVDTIAPTLVFTKLPYDIKRPKTNSRTVMFFFGVQSALDNKGGITFTCDLRTAGSTAPPLSSDCTLTKSVTYVNLGALNADIAYNFSVTARDQAQNTKTLTSDFAIDTKKPLVWMPPIGTTFLALPSRYTNKTAAFFTFSTDEPGQTDFLCRRDGSGTFTSCPTKPFMGLSQGEHSLQIQVQDWAGNIQTAMMISRPVNYTNLFAVNSTSSVFNWRVDTTPPPKPQINVKPALQTNIKKPQFQFTVAGSQIGGLSFSCQLALPGTLPIGFQCYQTTTVASTASPVPGVQGTGLLEGPYTMQVNAIDAAGNYGTSQRYSFTVDSRAPSVALDATSPSTANTSTNNAASMTFTFHAIDEFPERTDAIGHFRIITRNPCPLYNCTMMCALDGATLSPCTSPITYSFLTPAGSIGSHTFRVVATDNATNVGTGDSELHYGWTTDRIPPTTTFLATPAKAIPNDTATFTWQTTEPASEPPQFWCSLDNGATYNCTSTPVGGVYTWALQNLTHHFNHIFKVVAVDFYGNVAPAISYAWEVDLHPPTVQYRASNWATQGVRLGNPIVLLNGSYSNIAFVDFVFSTEPGSILECMLDNSPWRMCASPHRVSSLADGWHMFRIRAIDPVNHKTLYADQPYWTWITDTVGPTVTFSQMPKRYTSKLNSTFRATSSELATSYQCEYKSNQFQSGSTSWLPCLNPPFNGVVAANVLWVTLRQYAFSQTGTQINFVGDHTFLVRAVDRAGNIGPAKSWLFTVDITPPSIVTNGEPQPAVLDKNFLWSKFNYAEFKFQASEPVTYVCGVTPNISWVNPIPCSAPGVRINNIDKFGVYTFWVRATDLAGNSDPTTSVMRYTWTADPDPPTTEILSTPDYYTNRITNFTFQISTPRPRLRATCTIDRLHNNKTVWSAGTWEPCIWESQTVNSPPSVKFTADLDVFLNYSVAWLSMPDGFYSFKTRIMDVFNRTSKTAWSEFVVDTIPPQTALEGTIPYSISIPAITFTYFTSNPAYLHARFQCQLKLQDYRTALFTLCANQTYFCTWSSCGGTSDFVNTITGLNVKGVYQFSVRAVDKAGNWDKSPIVSNFRYDPLPPGISLTGVKPSKYASIADKMTFAFAGDEGTKYRCRFTRSDDPNNPRLVAPCLSPVTFQPPTAARQRNSSKVNFTVTGVDPFTGASRSLTYLTTLYNTTSLENRVADANARVAPIVCTNNNQVFFIVFIVCAVLTIVVIVVFVVVILRKMENKGLNNSGMGGAAGRKESRTPLTSFSNPQFSELHET